MTPWAVGVAALSLAGKIAVVLILLACGAVAAGEAIRAALSIPPDAEDEG